VEGWPVDIPFKPLSSASSKPEVFERLREGWESGAIHFRRLTDEELAAEDTLRAAKIAAGTVQPSVPRKKRSDEG
ncbi:hypothetical protein FA95DRAFT_1465426, partial [Auriscalpium vulgare]